MLKELEDLSKSKIFMQLSRRLFMVQWRERMVVILMYLSTWGVVWLSWPVHVGVWALLAMQTAIFVVVCVSFAMSFTYSDPIQGDGEE